MHFPFSALTFPLLHNHDTILYALILSISPHTKTSTLSLTSSRLVTMLPNRRAAHLSSRPTTPSSNREPSPSSWKSAAPKATTTASNAHSNTSVFGAPSGTKNVPTSFKGEVLLNSASIPSCPTSIPQTSTSTGATGGMTPSSNKQVMHVAGMAKGSKAKEVRPQFSSTKCSLIGALANDTV